MDEAKSARPHCDDGMMYSETGLWLHKGAVHKIFEVRHHQHHQDGRNDSDDSECEIVSGPTKDSKFESFFKPIETRPWQTEEEALQRRPPREIN